MLENLGQIVGKPGLEVILPRKNHSGKVIGTFPETPYIILILKLIHNTNLINIYLHDIKMAIQNRFCAIKSHKKTHKLIVYEKQ